MKKGSGCRQVKDSLRGDGKHRKEIVLRELYSVFKVTPGPHRRISRA
jgi:hypothetical protein